VESVLDGVVGAPGECLCDLRVSRVEYILVGTALKWRNRFDVIHLCPLISNSLLHGGKYHVLLGSPFALLHGGIKMIVPSLAALLSGAL
jgi:hypothetical protein